MIKKLLLSLAVATGLAQAEDGGYIFITFKGEQTPMTEQIYFGLSKDGKQWDALNGGNPVLVSQLGEKGVRDPYLLRSHDGSKFYVIATDLSINLNHDWGRSVRSGSKSIVIWESTDLTHWSEPRLVPVAADDAGCTWAPEAVYDEESKDYLVFWASTNKKDNFSKHRIWAARTKDFVTFSKPFVYIQKPNTVIDTTIVWENGTYYRFSKDEKDKAITMESSKTLMGNWKDVSKFTLDKLRGYEGPEAYIVEPAKDGKPAKWCLILDQYSIGAGYKPFVADELGKGQFKEASGFSFPFKFRHGSILRLTSEEYERVKAAY